MRCIILAGGLGTRLRPLTYTTPKSLLEIQGKPILQYTLEALPDEINTVVITVKHLGQKIKARFGKKFGKKKIIYVDLISLRGTMDALKQCKKYVHPVRGQTPLVSADAQAHRTSNGVKGKTLVLNGDDLYRKEDIVRLIEQSKKEPKKWFILVKKCVKDGPLQIGQVVVTPEGIVKDIIESRTVLDNINTGAYILDERIFRYKPARLPNGEFGLPQTMMQAKKDIPLIAIEASSWVPINTKEDYERANMNAEQRG